MNFIDKYNLLETMHFKIKMQENKMTQIRGGILGIGKKCLNRVSQMLTMALLVGAMVLAGMLTQEKKLAMVLEMELVLPHTSSTIEKEKKVSSFLFLRYLHNTINKTL